jgi:hypothetical protein
MRKVLFLILFIPYLCFSTEKVLIGVSPPFLKNQEVNSIFYHNQFLFEILSIYNNENYSIEIINAELNDDETIYNQNCIDVCKKNNFDYLLYTSVYTINDKLFFKFILKNPYNNIILMENLYIENNDYYINEYLTKDTIDIIKLINEKNLQIVKNKKSNINITKKDQSELIIESKHELFILNGFFKNNPLSVSFFSWYLGYNFVPFNFFYIEACFFWGSGNYSSDFLLDSKVFDNFYLGGYGSFQFFLDGIVQPSIGLRFEFGYVLNNIAYFSIPIDLGIKIKISNKDSIKINSSFQYTFLNFSNLAWEKGYTLGFLIGYARKI